MIKTHEIIHQAFRQYRPYLAYSGGGDSGVLLDIICSLGYKPPLIYADTQMEYNSGLPFVKAQAKRYGLTLHVATAEHTPEQVWKKHGYPMLGKMPARMWMQRHKASEYGFKVDVSTCCRKIKIEPARKLAKKLGCNAAMTGLRGSPDDRLRGFRSQKDGVIFYLKTDKLTQINPLDGWTDLMVSRYTKNHKLAVNPSRANGTLTGGCMYCGGGGQFDDSCIRVLRDKYNSNWRKMIIDFGFAPIIIAIKYEVPLSIATAALEILGGVEKVADTMPHVFDFLRKNPLRGYNR